MPNPVVHFEVLGKDAVKLQQYYADLFGWTIRSSAEFDNYGIVEGMDSTGIEGGIGHAPEGEGHVTFYVAVDDPQAYLDKAVSLGGKVTQPLTKTGSVVFALVADPEGHVVGVAKTPEQDWTNVASGRRSRLSELRHHIPHGVHNNIGLFRPSRTAGSGLYRSS